MVQKVGYNREMGLPRWLSGKVSACQCRRHGFNPWVRKIPWRRKWQPSPSILAWKIPWTKEPGGLQSIGLQESGTTESTCVHAHTHTHTHIDTHTHGNSQLACIKLHLHDTVPLRRGCGLGGTMVILSTTISSS